MKTNLLLFSFARLTPFAKKKVSPYSYTNHLTGNGITRSLSDPNSSQAPGPTARNAIRLYENWKTLTMRLMNWESPL